MEILEIGDKVRNKKLLTYNALAMTVKDIDENKILCEYFDSSSRTDKEIYFDADDLDIIQKVDGIEEP
ncbi:MAG: hypothetical protein HY840_09965 [Bacteroidetes bacterium]|nr:hypothetical protein [Bacteroidota bacterium]